MNRIYKVIWSKARNCYVVVSELAKRNGKCSSSLNRKIIASFLAAGLVAALPVGVEAHSIINGESGTITRTGPGSGVMWGTGTASGPRTTAFGANTNASTNNATAFGDSTKARQHNATSFGVGTYADSRQATAFGAYTYAGTVFTYNGEVVTPVRRVIDRYLDSSDPDTTPKEAWVLVKEDGTFVNTGQRFDGDYDAKGDITYSLNYQTMINRLSKSTASGDNQRSATAFGEYSIATGQDATAFGYRSAATAWSATAWGHETAALGKRSTAFGVETWASGNNATAFGYRTEATNENTTAWGSNTEASGVGATAWGTHTISGGDNSTTWGKNSEVGSGSLTYNGETYTNLSIQLTTYDGYNEDGSYTQIGHYYVQGRDKDGKLVTITEVDDDGNKWKWNYNGTADQAERDKVKEWIKSKGGTLAGDYSTAFGDSSRVDAENALGALGGIVNANATNSAAIGKESSVSSANAYAIGNKATIDERSDGSVALGGQEGTQTTIGEGATNSFAAIGGKIADNATNAIAVGSNASVTKADSIGIGTNTQATGTTTTAIGNNAKSTANYATSLGSGAAASGANATAVGNTASASAANATAVGDSASASAANATAVGDSASASAAAALASGNGATASKANATALGTSASASLENSVALGGSSTTTTGTSVTNETPKTGGIMFTDFAGSLTDTNRVVSVGTSGSTRQIQNVAAGAISPTSTDAINGSQLYAVANQLQWQIGIGKDTTTTGTNNVALAQSPVGKLDADTDKSNVQIVAGDGIDVSQFTTTDGYGIKVSNHIVKVEHEGLVFKGITTINGTYLTEAEVVDAVNNMITDERAIYASLIPNDVGGGYKIDLISPFLHINNETVKDDSGNLSARLYSTATGKAALALGINADAAGKNSIAIGHNADAKGHSEDATTYIEADAATAIGYNAHAHGPGSVAIGAAATTSGNRAIAVGSTARYLDTDTNYTTDNAHQGARAAGQGSIALGDQAKVLNTEYQTDASKIGSPDYKTNDSIAIGTRTQIQAKNAIALGGNTSYTYVDQTTGKSITVYGATNNVFAGNNYGAIVGLGADSGIAIGGAYGTFNSETKKIDQVYDAAEVYGLRGIAIGTGAKVADPNEFKRLTDKLSDATYIQKKEAFEEARSNYFAAKSEYESYVTIDPATDPTIPEEMRRNWDTNKQLALEALNRAEATMNEATAAYSLALKKVVRTQMDNSVTDTDAVAIGTQAIASVQDSIALGSKAATDENDQAGTTTGLSGYDPLSTTSDNDYFRGDSKYAEDDPVWRSNAGSLSLGGTYTTTDADGKETTTKITRRISNVAAGIDDADVVNVAQLKRATTITTANRSITIGTDAKGERLISTPYIHTQGVDDSAQYIALVTEYGDVAGYKTGLEKEVSEIQGRIDSINTTKGIINTKKAGLATQLANGEITQAEHDAELAEYNLQLEAIEERLSNLDSSKTAIQDKIDSGEYKTEFETAKTYYDAQATASGKESIAMGHGAKASGQQSVSVGNATSVAGDYSVAIGNSNEVKTANTFVLGNNVTNTVADSVFLGNNTAYVPSGTTTKGIETGYKSADVNGVTFGNFAGGNEVVGVVSVGGEVDGIKTTRRIQNVAPGLISPESTDAINGSQLYQAIQAMSINVVADDDKSAKVVRDPETGVGSGGGTGTAATTYTISAGKTTIEKTKDNLSKSGNLLIEDTLENKETDPKSYHYNIDLNKNIDLGEDGSLTVGESKLDTNGYQIGDTNIDKEGLSIKDGPSVKKDGINAGNKKIENVADGQGANDAVNVSQLQNSGISFNGDSGDSGLIKLGDQYNASFNVNGDKNITTEASAGQLKIKLKEQIDLGENGSVTIGNTTVKNNSVAIEGGPSMTDKGIDAGSQKITNVQAGTDPTDAVNVSQLQNYAAGNNQTINNLGSQITNVDSRARKGIAGAAALAALHPLEFDPDDKLTFAAGVGNYRGETAAAIGAFYRADEKVMFSIGGSMGNGENVVNAGVSFSLDRTPRQTSSRTAMAREIVELREQVAQLTAIVNQLAGGQLPKPPVMFPNTPENAWAYEYLENLQKKGNIVGYTGRELTRNEFAAALDRAMMSGAKLDERLIKEFEPELSHVRVSHVAGKGEDEGGWYERPRTSHDKLENQHEIAKKPLRPQEKSVTSKS